MLNRAGCGTVTMYLLLMALVIWLLSCNPQKQSAKLTYRALSKDSIVPVKIIMGIAPCITTSQKKDTVTRTRTVYDTVTSTQDIVVDCPPNETGAPVKTVVKADCKCVNKHTFTDRIINITAYVKDNADAYVLTKENQKLKTDADKYHSRAKTKGWIIAVLIGLFITYILLTKTFKIL